jgi:hypothetical protein
VEASSIYDSPPLPKGGLGGDSSNNLPLPLGGGKGGVFLTTGLLISLSVWLRPDGLTLLAPAVLVALTINHNWASRLRSIILIVAGFALLFLPYLLFNQAIAGAWWPNTYYAKQAEYAVLRQLPSGSVCWIRLSCPWLAQEPCFCQDLYIYAFKRVKKRSWGLLAASSWFLGYLGMYAWRLPVTYQHGRYVIPAMPVFFVLGLVGVNFIYLHSNLILRIISRVWAISFPLVLLAFWVIGANAYAQDVAIIEN